MSPTKTSTDSGTDTKAATPSGRAIEATSSTETSPLVTEQGKTRIADIVVSKVAGVAARQVPGVYKLGSGTARALGSIRERIPGQKISVTQGVAVEVGERQAAIDVDVVIEYGYPISDVADTIRNNIISSVEELVGLEVTEVNISVDDVHLPDDSDDETEETRVQ
jgi:uncharacterized alkaline shock family protein YloU